MDVSTLWDYYDYQYSGDRLSYTPYNNAVAGYDGIGNLTGYGDYYCNEYTWQGRELIASRDADYYDYTVNDGEIIISNEATYTYNANGIRTSKTVNGVTHKYILDGAQIVAETWVENNVERMMVFLYDDAGSPIGFLYRTSAYDQNEYDAYFYEKNFFGDVEKIYNESGTCVAQYVYNAWGEHQIWQNTNGIANLNPIRYRGYYYDTHTGLYYLQSRYYNPAWGRFISADCYVSTGQGLLGNNMYIYCNNNPVMYVDPTGEIALTTALIVLGIAAAIGGIVGGVSGYQAAKADGKTGADLWKETVEDTLTGVAVGGIVGALGIATAGFLALSSTTAVAIGTSMLSVSTFAFIKNAEIVNLQASKSRQDGDNGWQIADDCMTSIWNNSFATTGQLLLDEMGGMLIGKSLPNSMKQLKIGEKYTQAQLGADFYFLYQSSYTKDPSVQARYRGYVLQ